MSESDKRNMRNNKIKDKKCLLEECQLSKIIGQEGQPNHNGNFVGKWVFHMDAKNDEAQVAMEKQIVMTHLMKGNQ